MDFWHWHYSGCLTRRRSQGASAELVSLISDCLAKDAEERPSGAFIVDLL